MYSLTREQVETRKAAREFAEGEFRDIALELDKKETFDERLWQKAAELGFLGVFVEEKYDGLGMGYLDQCVIVEEFARVDLGIAHAIESTFFGTQLIQLIGSEEQKMKYLPAICNGEMRMGMAITEPDAGSDVSAVSTTAVLDNDEYVINGSKVFITNANLADFIVVLCVTDPDNPKKHKRFSTIIVETDRAGYSATPYHGKLSLRASNTGDVVLKNVRVPKENLLGKAGQGFYNIMEFFNRSRVQVAALSVGTAQGALDKAVSHVRNRSQFGKPLANLQLVQGKIAEMATKTEVARSVCYRAASMLDSGTPDPGLSSMAKWYCAEVAVQVADEAIQLHGGYGILEEYGVAHYWRNAKVLEIFEGSKEVEKVIIARKILGRF
ncbi:acyl-CoA dehydrogenase family protein [Desulfonema magnum]|uniref:Acyl-CoA dehydrogenase n=1 Tax=Desulfonema magnum TaxID=45655 RepID=A0A975BL78_9BACT|nr:acyl-CoA dehydrogenase family protein [Desulfonema magnum]QTA87129.1 Acyl-CoA dehydrogenase [Desulfonema magnum]